MLTNQQQKKAERLIRQIQAYIKKHKDVILADPIIRRLNRLQKTLSPPQQKICVIDSHHAKDRR